MTRLPLLATLLLCACSQANAMEIWVRNPDYEPATVRQIYIVDKMPDGCSTALGCAVRAMNIIFIASRLTPWLTECVIKHERRHIERAEDHPYMDVARSPSIDCGDGTTEEWPR